MRSWLIDLWGDFWLEILRISRRNGNKRGRKKSAGNVKHRNYR